MANGERGTRGAGPRKDATRKEGPRAAAAARHLSVMKAVFATETRESIEHARVVEAGYAPEAAVPEGAEPTRVSFAERGDIVAEVLRAEGPVAVLDAASYRYPGGSYLRGWRGDEEDLCDGGNLCAILEAFQKDFYDENKQTASGELYTSRALSIPDVVFTRDGAVVKAAVVAMAAPSRTRALDRRRSERECDLALEERVDAAMRILASLGAQTVVLPAFGCSQGNAPAEVARLFHAWIEAHDGAIPQVSFAIRRREDEDAFKAAFADRWREPAPEPDPASVPAEEDDDVEEDWEKYRISE